MRRIVIVVSLVALLAGACNGESETETFGSTSEEDLVRAITGGNSVTLDSRFGDNSTGCISQGIVDEFGVDGLAELGVTQETPDLQGGAVFVTQEAARRVVDITIDCVDLGAEILASLPEDVNLLNDSVECIVDQLEGEAFRDLFAALVMEGGEPEDIVSLAGAQLPLAALLLQCLSPEEFLRFDDLLN